MAYDRHRQPPWRFRPDFGRYPQGPRDDGPAFGYRGPGTDLGEDIRRGYVRRGGRWEPPPAGLRGPPYPVDRYRGPGTGEDLRRGYVRRSGYWPAPPAARYDAGDFRSGDWTGPLRRGWEGVRHVGGRFPRGR